MRNAILPIYTQIFKIWRRKRMMLFEETIQPQPRDRVLDVGGVPNTWTKHSQKVARIDCLNIYPMDWQQDSNDGCLITTSVGNGCELEFENGSYDILFSNSVIEHVGDWHQQKAFAEEAKRVGKRLWIQTPAFECPLEPHYLAPFVHWLPVGIRRHFLRWFTPWGWLSRPNQDEVDKTIYYTRLLTKRQVQELFPDCEIITERLWWVFPKSYIVYRKN